MTTNRYIRIREQNSRVQASVNQAVANCKQAIIGEADGTFKPMIHETKAEIILLLNLMRELEDFTAVIVNGDKFSG